MTILATVISTPTSNRAVIDAGSKVLTSDLIGLEGHGLIVDHPTLKISQLSEEHGCITSDRKLGLRYSWYHWKAETLRIEFYERVRV